MNYFLLTLIGFLGGITSGLFGVGGGVIYVPLMVMLLGFGMHQAVGTSLAVVIGAGLVAATRYAMGGMVSWKSLPWMILAAMAGAWLGATFSLGLDQTLLRRLFAVFLFGMSLKLFFSN